MKYLVGFGLGYFALQSFVAAGRDAGYLAFALVFVALAIVSYRLIGREARL